MKREKLHPSMRGLTAETNAGPERSLGITNPESQPSTSATTTAAFTVPALNTGKCLGHAGMFFGVLETESL